MPPMNPPISPSSVLLGEIRGVILREPNNRPAPYAAVSPTKVATRTSTRRAPPWSGRSRSSDRVREADPEPDDREQRHRDRDGHVLVAPPARRDEEDHREGGGHSEQDVEGGPVLSGDDHRGDGQIRRDLDRRVRGGHPEELAQAERAEGDHRQHEHRPADRDDRDREDDPRDHDHDPLAGLRPRERQPPPKRSGPGLVLARLVGDARDRLVEARDLELVLGGVLLGRPTLSACSSPRLRRPRPNWKVGGSRSSSGVIERARSAAGAPRRCAARARRPRA